MAENGLSTTLESLPLNVKLPLWDVYPTLSNTELDVSQCLFCGIVPNIIANVISM